MGDEDVGLSEGVAAGAMLARPEAKFLRPPVGSGVNPLGKALPFASWWHFPPNITHSGLLFSEVFVKQGLPKHPSPGCLQLQQIQEHVFICTFNKISPGGILGPTGRKPPGLPCWASWFTHTKNILGLGIQGCIDTPERTWAFQWSSSSCTV